MSAKISAICNEIGSEYHASIITNGYLVDNEIADILKKCSIRTAQVTLDGIKETHDMRRRLLNGQGTYEKTKRAVFLLAEKGINVAVRVNLDKSNIHEYKNVCDIFKENKNINCYPAVVTVEENQTICQKSLCYTHAEYEKFYNAIWKDVPEDEKRKIEQSMQSGICNCAAEHVYSYLIGPNGNLYKCLNDICSCEYAVGHVSENISGIIATAKYLGRDPFTEPECSQCPYIPICYGGCVFEYKKHDTHACKAVKFMYKNYCQEKIGGERYEGNYQKEK
ncbi:MAG: SPASM domain-containing protein [Lachnospiraceae bacterium]|nr:SPASM domain-containing protein [Lachnospiraceae bacterium]